MITIYEATATDFGGNGLGTLAPESCLVSETLNGEYEVTLVHPIDEAGKFRRLQENRILRVPVPAGKTPRMAMSAQQQTSTEIYKVTTGGMRLYLRAQPSQSAKGLHAYKPNTEVVLIAKTNAQWYEVTTPDGKHGYMYAANLTYVRTETTGAAAEEAIKEPTTLRDQPFRIYRIVPTLTNITVYARHIFYDLMDNMVSSYAPDANTTGAAALTGLMAAALSAQDFTFYSDLDTTAEGVEITDKNPAEAILGDGGLIENYGGELARDWWDVYLAKRAGEETGIQIREGKNLTGITYSVDYTNVTTRIMPRGEDKDGKPLYLPEKYIDSANISAYPTIKWALMDVKDAKEKTKGDDRRTKEECYTLMRQAAQDAYDAGDDLPDVTLNVSFIDCAETEEYSQYRNLQGIHLGDTVKVIAKRVGVSVAMRMTQYTYNCLTRRYEAMTLGTIDDGIEGNMISPRSIGSGSISGRMIKLGSIGTGALQDGAVNSLKIALAAISYAHIDEAAINKLSVNAVTAIRADIRQLVAGQITTDQLYVDLAAIAVAQITAANIEKANIDWANIKNLTAEIAKIAKAQITKANIEEANIDWAEIKNLTAAIADIANANIGTAKIDWAKIYDLTADTAIITEGVGGKLYIARLAVTEANMTSLTVGELMVKAADGSFKRLTVDVDGNVTAETVQVEGDNVANATIPGGKLIENTITARELNVESIFADKALIRAIKAANIDVSDLFAAEATISALDSWLIRASTITALEGKLDVWASEKITLAVKNVQIGGTNLLHHTGDMSAAGGVGFSYDASGASAQGTAVRQDDGSMLVTNSASNLRFVHSRLAAAAGEVYTVSAEYKDVSGACPHQFQVLSSSDTNDMIQNAVSEGDKTTLADGWVRSVFTFVIPEGATYVTPFFRSGTDYTLYTHQYYIRRPKLERGNKATDWSPNPADMEARMSEAESTITQQADEIAARVTQTTYNAGMAGKANASDLNALSERVSTAETSITQNANAITSKASQSDMDAIGNRVTAAESEIEQTPSKISAAVSAVQVGGTNLLHGISVWGLIDGQGFTFDSSGADAMGAYTAQSDGSLLVTNNGSNVRIIHGNIAVQPGEVYTVSAEYKDISGECPHQFQMAFANSAGAFAGNAISVGDKTALADGWVKSVLTFTIPESVVQLMPYFRSGTDYTLYTHQYYIRRPKLERGNKATDWSPNPNEVRDIRVGSNILMDVNHTEISTPYLDIDVSGTEGDMHIDEHGISGGTGTFKTLNCPDVVKSTGSAIYSGGLQETFDALNGRFLTGNVTISLSADQYGTFVLKGVYGVNASINIVGNGHSVNGVLAVYNCKLTNVGIGGMTINGNGSSTSLVLIDAGFVSVSGVTINGGGAGTAVDANYGTRLMMYDNGLYNASNLIRLGHCTEGSLIKLRGGTCTNYLRADGARWTMSGTRPDGTYAEENTCLHAPENPDSLTIDYGTSQPPVTPVTTESFTANVTGTYYPSGHWINSDNYIRQGFEGKTSTRKDYGCMWFNAGALAGKTIKSAMLTLTRRSGKGRSSSVTVTLWTTTLTGKSGKPTDTMVSLGEIGKIQNGETATFSIPTSAISVIAAGGGLVTYTGETANAANKDYSPNYAHFYGVDTDGPAPVLTVTYQ